jgi:hypothetical protein
MGRTRGRGGRRVRVHVEHGLSGMRSEGCRSNRGSVSGAHRHLAHSPCGSFRPDCFRHPLSAPAARPASRRLPQSARAPCPASPPGRTSSGGRRRQRRRTHARATTSSDESSGEQRRAAKHGWSTRKFRVRALAHALVATCSGHAPGPERVATRAPPIPIHRGHRNKEAANDTHDA